MSEEKKAPDSGARLKLPTDTAAARPLVTVYTIDGQPTKKSLPMPDVMLSPIRADLVNYVHTNLAKNHRQPYAVMNREGPHGVRAGHQVAAKSWGTGRAVSRVPRVKGGGTHRAGQGAYANMCRGGRMFAPTKVWRKWHRKVSITKQRFAVCSALAGSAVPALVMARGHRINEVDEIPLVVENDFESFAKTKAAFNMLEALHLEDELARCKRRYIRAGKGKMRNRRWRHRLGPLIIYAKDDGLVKAFRNLRGVDSCSVYDLNLLQLAPGGHVGRLVVWTEDAFKELNNVYGTSREPGKHIPGYHPPRAIMKNSDLDRLINSEEIQSVLKPKREKVRYEKKRNPLRHPDLYAKFNPLFEEQWSEIKKTLPPGARPTTLQVLEPLRKKQKVEMKLTEEEEKQMMPYWKNVFGDDKIFKSAELLAAEREAVEEALAAQEREKAGLDLMEVMEEDEEEEDVD